MLRLKYMIRKLFYIFLLSLGLNFVWENLHSFLYASYQGGPIGEFILLRAALGDAVLLGILALPFFYLDFFKKRKWLIIPIGVAVAILIELYALHTGRWAYNSYMPLIPFLDVGLTPTLQLGLLGWVVYFLMI